jgi:hypothetical protein
MPCDPRRSAGPRPGGTEKASRPIDRDARERSDLGSNVTVLSFGASDMWKSGGEHVEKRFTLLSDPPLVRSGPLCGGISSV